jgi:DNA topoisomerase I
MKEHILRKIKMSNNGDLNYEYFKGKKKLKNNHIINDYLKGIYIPPAYDNVIIYKNKKSDVMAIGEDSKGRKQYIYNKSFKEISSKYKFCELIDFGKNYSKIYKSILYDIKNKDDEKNNLIAIILKLIIDCNFRVGNEKYTKDNKSFGVSTLQHNHIIIDYNNVIIDFIGKKGVQNTCYVKNKHIKEFLKKRKKTHKKIFSYKNRNKYKKIKASDVNNYLKTFGDFTTKNFRTWGANIKFIKYLLNSSEKTNNKNIKQAIDFVSNKLHHTPNVCKNNYIEPTLITFYKNDKESFINFFGKSKNNSELSKRLTKFLKKNYK